MPVTITVNGKQIEAPDGALLIDVCAQHGIDIPHFCYHPGLGPDGNCRMCQVEFITERGGRLGISCKSVVAEGMVVDTQSAAAKRARASVEEMLLLNHPLDCPICDKAGECTLQNYYMEHDLQNGRQDFTRFKKEKAKDIGPTLILDQERCVLCDRCVRFLRDVAGEEQLYIAGRGHEAYITTFPGQDVTSPYSLNTVDICPVGALTSKDFRFDSATWFLKNTNSVCTSCARGCSMQIQTRNGGMRDAIVEAEAMPQAPRAPEHNRAPGRIYRMRPRHNPDVNGYWACDEGRTNYQFVNHDRVTKPSLRKGNEVFVCSSQEAHTAIRTSLGFAAAGTVSAPAAVKSVVLLSATCTLEEMFLFQRVAKECLHAPVMVARHVPDGVDDHLLRRADKHPNARGAELLGLPIIDLKAGADAASVTGALGNGGVLLAVGFNTHVSPALDAILAHAGAVIAVSGCTSALTERADLTVPGLTFAEKDGIVVNFEGHAQTLRPALDPKGETEWCIADALLSSLTGGKRYESVAHVRKAIMDEVPAFAGTDLVKLGLTGARVAAPAVAR
ncbi:MAG TPA: 2Fe-2S iron-sulfur cluster-binding protein [Candidatus Krumholzibacteria bacterium]|nr:2Fe-2S iron-sulfur cluster-binding protein [Candidatus Krumholzibacteria bacterium]